MTVSTDLDSPATTVPVRRRTLAVAAISTVVEWYDLTLYLYLATVLSRVFFGGETSAVLTALATFALAYLLRPSAPWSSASSVTGTAAGRCCWCRWRCRSAGSTPAC